ncbi:MAG: HEAT repeat domain-containing protein [Planctomycetota bacterium]|jgi:HEAT repeat protein
MKILAAIVIIAACGASCFFVWQQTQIMKSDSEKIALLEKMLKDIKKPQNDDEVKKLAEKVEELQKTINSTPGIIKEGDMAEAAILLSKSNNKNITNSVCHILGYIGGEKAEQRLIEMCENSENPYSPMNALARMGSSKALKLALDKLKTGTKNEKSSASGMLPQLIKPENVVEVAQILPTLLGNDYTTRNIRNNIIRALGEAGDIRATEYIVPFIRNADNNTVYSLMDAMNKLKDPLAAPEIIELYNNSNDNSKKNIERYAKEYPGIIYDKEKKTLTLVSEEKMKKLLDYRKKQLENLKKALQMRKKQGKEMF